MAENPVKWPSGRGLISNIGLSDGRGNKIVPEIAEIGYCRSGFDGYPGNAGQNPVELARDFDLGVFRLAHCVIS